jgi:antitoxin YefM
MHKINNDAERVVVTSNDDSNVVVMSETDYNSWMETFYLMSTPTNRKRIEESIHQLENSLGTEHQLAKVDE